MSNFRRVAMPYCLVKCSDGRWLVLNRIYTPIGCTSDEIVNYDTVPGVRVKLTKRQRVYLYNDGCSPAHPQHRPGYFKRLSVLLTAEVRS